MFFYRMNKRWLTAGFLVIFPVFLSAQEEKPVEEEKSYQEDRPAQQEKPPFQYLSFSSLGILGSTVSGAGFSYRYHTPAPWLFQITGGVLILNKESAYNLGGEIQYELSHSLSWRFFFAIGGGVYGSRAVVEEIPGVERTQIDNRFHGGLGFGVETSLGRELLEGISLGFTLFPVALYQEDIFPGISLYLFYNL